jgi:heme oxygenase (mycobilin-producing)
MRITTSRTMTVIDPVEVPAGEADEQFVHGWERGRDFLASRNAFAATALHRSLAPDAEFRYVSVAWVESAEQWQQAAGDPAFPELSFAEHPSIYEPVRDEWTQEVPACVVLINAFEVPLGEDESFLAHWDRAHRALAVQPGYFGARLHVSLVPQADFRFVNTARWETPEAFGRALQQPEFGRARPDRRFTAHPSLYEVIRAA